ncbi:hypothetical protein Hanom_Chr02g00132661 [Helianthus anomalus]
MFTSNFRRCPFGQKLTGAVLYVSKSCTLCPLGQTQLDFLVKSGHVFDWGFWMQVAVEVEVEGGGGGWRWRWR